MGFCCLSKAQICPMYMYKSIYYSEVFTKFTAANDSIIYYLTNLESSNKHSNYQIWDIACMHWCEFWLLSTVKL